MKRIRLFVDIALVLFLCAIAFVNREPVVINLVLGTVNIPCVLLILIVFMIGFLMGKLIQFRKKP